MNTAKRLAMAAGAFLQYEFACQRDTLFNERSLVTPISNVLKAVYKHDVHTEFLHPVLAPLKSGPGRKPEVDFAEVQKYPEIICAVETKRVGAAGIKMEDLLWDVLRLELIAHTAKADAYFVLAGHRGAPSWILNDHLEDQLANLLRRLFPSDLPLDSGN